MSHSKRHLPYAVTTVLGLTAPALAAVLLTSSVPTSAAPVPERVVVDVPAPLHAPVLRSAPAPRVLPSPAATRAATRTATRTAAPVVRKAVAAPVRKTVTARSVTPKRTSPTPSPTATATRTSTTSTSSTAQPKGTDDYPYRTQSDFYAVDRWGFTQRQCVSFAAWRLAQHGDTIDNKDNWGSAYSWDEAARRLGHVVTSRPRVGAIAQWNANEGSPFYAPGSAKANGTFTAGGYGHVGWVKSVYSDGSVLIEQYNLGGSRDYSVMRVKAPRYLVIG